MPRRLIRKLIKKDYDPKLLKSTSPNLFLGDLENKKGLNRKLTKVITDNFKQLGRPSQTEIKKILQEEFMLARYDMTTKGMSLAQKKEFLLKELESEVKLMPDKFDTSNRNPVISAFERVPRELFVSPELKEYAYANLALPIGHGQTISQPYTGIVMLDFLELRKDSNSKALEIGAGSGIMGAWLKEITDGEIHLAERIPELKQLAERNLTNANYKDVKVHLTEKEIGLKENSPFDWILVSCAASKVPMLLLDQLKPDGRLVMPLSIKGKGTIIVAIGLDPNRKPVIKRKSKGSYAFVPLIKS